MSFVFLQIEGCHNILVYEIGFKKAALVTNGLIVKVLHNRFFIGQPPGFADLRIFSPCSYLRTVLFPLFVACRDYCPLTPFVWSGGSFESGCRNCTSTLNTVSSYTSLHYPEIYSITQ